MREYTYDFEEIKKAIIYLEENHVNTKTAKEIFKEIIQNKLNHKAAIKLHKVVQINDEIKILEFIYEVLDNNIHQLEKLSKNLLKLEKFVMGELMKKTKGQINLQLTAEIFKKNIDNYLFNKIK